MSDYYEPHPRVLLRRPMVVAGHLGCGAARVGRILCARTGLPFVEIDRRIEHALGGELARLARQRGLSGLARASDAALEQALAERPCGVVVLDRAWPSGRVLDLVAREADLVHLSRPARERDRRVGEALLRDAAWLAGAPADQSDGSAALERIVASVTAREALLQAATVLLEAEDKADLVVARILYDAIDPAVTELASEGPMP